MPARTSRFLTEADTAAVDVYAASSAAVLALSGVWVYGDSLQASHRHVSLHSPAHKHLQLYTHTPYPETSASAGTSIR